MRRELLNFEQKQLNISGPYNWDKITWKVWSFLLAEVRQGKVEGVNNMSGSVNMWLISKLIEKNFWMNVEGEVTVLIMELSKHARSTLLDYPGRLKETENQWLNLRLSIQMVLSDMIARSRMHSLIHISIQFSFRHCCSIIYSLDKRDYCPSSDAKCKQIIIRGLVFLPNILYAKF